jgi:hypothetical protein
VARLADPMSSPCMDGSGLEVLSTLQLDSPRTGAIQKEWRRGCISVPVQPDLRTSLQ